MQTRFAAVVATSDAVAATPRRSEKTALLATLLSAVDPAEVAICVGLLSGEPRQGASASDGRRCATSTTPRPRTRA